MLIPPLRIGELTASIPIIQGGMGVGVSRSRLAAAVANEGGIGVISGVHIGFSEPDFDTNSANANVRAISKEIRKAKEISPNGVIGVNLLVAMNNYEQLVKSAVEAGVDLIISGAGLPTALPAMVKGTKTKAVPIVSSGKAATVITKLWDHRYSYIPDLIIVEGPEAGGHLGFSLEQLEEGKKPKLEDIVIDVKAAIKPFEEKYNKHIPIVAAGGIFDGKDIARFLRLGADGVQMATRFVATYECDADLKYKNAYLNCEADDITIIKSPVGLPGRAVRNKFVRNVEISNMPVDKCYGCLKPCNPKDTPYCISRALINAVKGEIEDGLIFTGSNAYRLDKIVSVKELVNELITETERELETNSCQSAL